MTSTQPEAEGFNEKRSLRTSTSRASGKINVPGAASPVAGWPDQSNKSRKILLGIPNTHLFIDCSHSDVALLP
jgi:hypothetical protein